MNELLERGSHFDLQPYYRRTNLRSTDASMIKGEKP